MEDRFDSQLRELDIDLDKDKKKQFMTYYELLIEWNKLMNLTGITEQDEVNEKHFVDSLAIVKAVSISDVKSVIDIGTGAGFPGLPLKIAFPHLQVVLLDSLHKRINFLNTVIEKLKLQNIKALHGRAEDFAKQKEYREQFDLCVSRAVANLSTLSEYCIPYIRVGGIFISYKSGNIEEELQVSKKAVTTFGGKIEKTVRFELPRTDIGRSFVIIKKEEHTKEIFPRKAGMPAKSPI